MLKIRFVTRALMMDHTFLIVHTHSNTNRLHISRAVELALSTF